ncbi:NAD(P)/FAD-dependent oxidoreductase [Acinetobacter sp. XH1741]|uniref:flavin-containing monooxygenase n=1 Tax=unclassified Acinetobacter TaxID=196816 RepID=UPI0032B50A01
MSQLSTSTDSKIINLEVIVIGAGLSGIAAGIKLLKSGIKDFLILEKSHEIGGVWRDNTYPGCECDIPSALYSYSFAPNPKWNHVFAKQTQIKEYIEDVAHQHHLYPKIKFNQELQQAKWLQQKQCWEIKIAETTYYAKFVFFAGGPLSHPAIPKINGMSKFKGKMFHSAQWDHSVDLTGKRVAVVGTGASAIQIIPAIQKQVDQLYVFQRTAPWVIPKPNMELGKLSQSAMKNTPLLLKFVRLSTDISMELLSQAVSHPKSLEATGKVLIQWMHSQIKDPNLRKKVTPQFTMGCKRILFSNTYYSALATSNTTVIAQGVEEMTENGIVVDGKEIPLDIIIWGTGFEVTQAPIAKKIVTKTGETLAEMWSKNKMQAYKGCVIQNVPNAIYVLGPNSLNYNSFITTAEIHIGYGIQAMKSVIKKRKNSFEVNSLANDSYNQKLQHALDKTVFNRGGCVSYYLDDQRVNVSNYPWTIQHMRNDLRYFDEQNYSFI